ncbi:S8 family serine peptidase [Streptomyces sp. NPDC020965]|uniref:S8 family serine peptidase n=1 Tax=Streptomyces sp. NPDC020965 TaxID=3365105 RepID=UPI0037B17EA5
MAGRRPERRGALAALTAVALALPLALGATPAQALPTQALPDPGAGASAAPSPYRAKAEAPVRARLDAGDRATFWVALSHEADTSAVRQQRTRTDRARLLLRTKQEHAQRTQAPLKALLDAAGAEYESFWITNTLKVTTDAAVARTIAARPEVAALEADDPIPVPDPLPGRAEPRTDAVEWNIDRVNAPKVWSEFGARGEGVVVANIDTGVQLDHPAVKAKYRGLRSDGGYDHAYNWFDPAKVCTVAGPCDNNGHGTHTMGTMVGDDGAGNQIGVAPGARWIAAKGCESSSCSRDSLLRSGQWIVAPTDAAGANPRPDLAPDIVNNSWGSGVFDAWYKTVVQSWRDAGIFPAFSNGNNGPSCNSAGSPGSYANSYASGAFDINNAIASFSSRGTGEAGTLKPNLAAPGVNIRSAWTGGGYNAISGTSMASPHTAATVALLWSAAPALRGDIAATEKLLDASAVDVDNTTCGGTAADNNVFGEGRLDAHAAVTAAPRGPLGAVGGTVTSGTSPVADAELRFDGPMRSTVSSGANGTYALPKLMVGEYRVTVSKFGYVTATGAVTVVEGASTVKDFALDEAASADVTGRITGHSGAEANAVVTAQGTPVSTRSAADGGYALRLPVGTYDLAVTPAHRCASATSVRVEVTAATVRDIALPDRTDTFGTACSVGAAAFPEGATKLAFSSEFFGTSAFALPFPVALYGRTYRTATASVDGVLSFGASSTSGVNGSLPTTGTPNGALYPFWDNLTVDAAAGVYWSATGTAPHRKIVVEWRNALIGATTAERISFAAVLSEDGTASFHYKDVSGAGFENGSSATIGAENATGTDALLYSYNEATVRDGASIHLRTTKSAIVAGTVTDANDGKAVAGASVAVTAGGAGVGSDTVTADGGYLAQVPAPADYDLTLSAPAYAPVSGRQGLKPGETGVLDAALTTGRVAADTSRLTVIAPAGQQRARAITLVNTGSATPFTVAEKDGKGWITAAPGSGELAAGGSQEVRLSIDTTGAAPGSVLTGTLAVTSRSGRAPVIDIPVSVVVPAYQRAVDSGATRSVVDPLGDTWTADQAYTVGGHGYLGSSTRQSISRPVVGVPATSDPVLYRTARQGMYEYRFDALPPGTYRVELGFAEPATNRPTQRVFDVMAEGIQFVPNLDLALEAGVRTAHDRSFTVTVTDGQLNLRFVANSGKTLVNSIKVTERPDLTG